MKREKKTDAAVVIKQEKQDRQFKITPRVPPENASMTGLPLNSGIFDEIEQKIKENKKPVRPKYKPRYGRA